MKLYIITTTHVLIAVYDDKEAAKKAVEMIKESGVTNPHKLYMVEYDTKEAGERVAEFIAQNAIYD